ncbi:MAG: phosphoribosylanthranilate isomerase [Candidatus Omnitrophica bacterium]|jgi:phosphoribosylanthranilate isomerase|nr:phosphoribosylanthranilate isomerase [Candidatus Omnitrophota bacterium]
MIKVKICGITNLEDALACSNEGADALGFIFSKKSPRYINEKEAAKVISGLDPYITKVGVFLDEEKEKVFEIANMLSLDILQFHGKEIPSYCSAFAPKFKIVKVFFPEDAPFKVKVPRYKIDAAMFDIKYEQKSKGKNTLDKNILKEISALIKEGSRVIISGGLNVKNISQITRLKPYAVDVSSGLEKFVGKKDIELVREFIKKVKNASSK